VKRRAFLAVTAAASVGVPAGAQTATRFTFGGCPPEIAPPVRTGPGPTEIVAVWFSRPAYKWGELARIVVVTSTNAALVEMRVVSYGRALTRRRPGVFEGVYRMPFMPPPLDRLHIGLAFRFTGRSEGGPPASVWQTVPVG